MVKKESIVLSLMLLSSAMVYADEAPAIDINEQLNELQNAGTPAPITKTETCDESISTAPSDSTAAEVLNAAGSISPASITSEAQAILSSASTVPALSTSALDQLKPEVSADLIKQLLALSSAGQAEARKALVSAQLEEIAKNTVDMLIDVKEFTDNHVRLVRAQLADIAGEHRQAALDAIKAAVADRLREINAELSDCSITAAIIQRLRQQSDNLRKVEAGLHWTGQMIVKHASEADAEMAAMWVPGSPRTKRRVIETFALVGTSAAATFGYILFSGAGNNS